MEKEKLLIKYLKDYFLICAKELNIEYKYKTNVPLAFSSIGKFAETLSSILFNMKGTGSRGSGYDLRKENKTIEVKSVFRISYSECQACNNKTSFTLRKCIFCGTDIVFNNKNTSRWGINAKTFLSESDSMEKLSLIDIYDDISWKTNSLILKIKVYTINPKNNYFVKYAQNQKEISSKSNTLNFLPESFDFYMSSPKEIMAAEVLINWKKIWYKNLSFQLHSNPKVVLLPYEKLKTTEKELLTSSDVFEQNDIMYVRELSMCKLDLRKKALNKDRGEIKRHKIYGK